MAPKEFHATCIFILDGAPFPSGAVCGVKECFEPSAGSYEVLLEETNKLLLTIQLCTKHGKLLATGLSA